jgi:hypothetical protein
MAESLTVRAAGAALVTNYEAMNAGARRFIGRTFVPDLGVAGAWPAIEDVTKVPASAEYLKHIADGALVACDEATAKAAGIKFDAKAAKTAESDAKEFWAKRAAAEKAPDAEAAKTTTTTNDKG